MSTTIMANRAKKNVYLRKMIGKLNILNVIRREKFKAYYPFFSQNIQSGIIIAGGGLLI